MYKNVNDSTSFALVLFKLKKMCKLLKTKTIKIKKMKRKCILIFYFNKDLISGQRHG